MNKIILRNYAIAFGISLILMVLFGYLVKLQPGSHNDISRLAGIIAVARYNELDIDSTIQEEFTVDKVQYEGQFYSSKPPVLNWGLGKVTKLAFSIKPVLLNNDVAIYRLSTFLAVVLPLIGIFLTFLYLISDRLKRLTPLSLFFAIFLIFGTLLFSYSGYLNNHIFVAFAQLLLFYLMYFVKKPSRNWLRYLAVGFLMSLILVLDVTYAFVCLPISIIFLYLVYGREFWIKEVAYIILGALPLTILHFGLNYIQFGILIPPQLLPDIYLSYEGSNWLGKSEGIESQKHNYILRSFNYMFGTYGFFLYQPLLLLPFFVKKNWRDKIWLYIVVLLISYMMFNIITSPNYGGSAFGPRRFIPLIPLFYYYVVFATKRLIAKNILVSILIVMLYLLNCGISYLGFINTWDNWNYYSDKPGKSLYFPLLYSVRKVLRWYDLEHLLDFME